MKTTDFYCNRNAVVFETQSATADVHNQAFYVLLRIPHCKLCETFSINKIKQNRIVLIEHPYSLQMYVQNAKTSEVPEQQVAELGQYCEWNTIIR